MTGINVYICAVKPVFVKKTLFALSFLVILIAACKKSSNPPDKSYITFDANGVSKVL